VLGLVFSRSVGGWGLQRDRLSLTLRNIVRRARSSPVLIVLSCVVRVLVRVPARSGSRSCLLRYFWRVVGALWAR
jgi:hypothetical protein